MQIRYQIYEHAYQSTRNIQYFYNVRIILKMCFSFELCDGPHDANCVFWYVLMIVGMILFQIFLEYCFVYCATVSFLHSICCIFIFLCKVLYHFGVNKINISILVEHMCSHSRPIILNFYIHTMVWLLVEGAVQNYKQIKLGDS